VFTRNGTRIHNQTQIAHHRTNRSHVLYNERLIGFLP